MSMQFEFEQYYRNHFLVPMILSIILLSVLILIILISISRMIQWRAKRKINIEELVKSIIGIAVFAFLLSKTSASLLRGGWHLWSETENDAVYTCGIVESIRNDDLMPKYTVDGERCYGAIIVLNNEEYYLMSSSGVDASSLIEITYLPQSRYVLSITQKTASTTDDTTKP